MSVDAEVLEDMVVVKVSVLVDIDVLVSLGVSLDVMVSVNVVVIEVPRRNTPSGIRECARGRMSGLSREGAIEQTSELSWPERGLWCK